MDFYVKVNGREYFVRKRPDGYVTISVSFEVIPIGDHWKANPGREWRSRAVSPEGRLGKKILKELAKMEGVA